MPIQHCVKCDKSYDIGLVCPICSERLVYLGREELALSPIDILEQYDSKHPYNPLRDYTGDYFTNTHNPAQEAMVVECEDTLKRHPEDADAGYHLSLYYLSKGHLEHAERYISKVIEAKPNHSEPYQKAASIYMTLKKPEKAHPVLIELSKREVENTQVWENLGKVCLSLNKAKEALFAFDNANKHCEDKEKKESLKTAMKQIKSYLDKISR